MLTYFLKLLSTAEIFSLLSRNILQTNHTICLSIEELGKLNSGSIISGEVANSALLDELRQEIKLMRMSQPSDHNTGNQDVVQRDINFMSYTMFKEGKPTTGILRNFTSGRVS
ncbi:hypothetical protein KEM48_012513 [Puccinia striiformis f. sp. tritici PST-130]|nr:hypothetical protein H4Q26_013527 [Puccinia striiformis f. sp. tritici PST-130]KAI9629878.1 hypothetical protein KEM48_012513 [Puccinia striiformis f. sp. tritici PST-130]